MYTFDVVPQRAYFTRRKYVARIYRDARRIDDMAFCGNDGRTVRADAVRWAHARLALAYNSGE